MFVWYNFHCACFVHSSSTWTFSRLIQCRCQLTKSFRNIQFPDPVIHSGDSVWKKKTTPPPIADPFNTFISKIILATFQYSVLHIGRISNNSYTHHTLYRAPFNGKRKKKLKYLLCSICFQCDDVELLWTAVSQNFSFLMQNEIHSNRKIVHRNK